MCGQGSTLGDRLPAFVPTARGPCTAHRVPVSAHRRTPKRPSAWRQVTSPASALPSSPARLGLAPPVCSCSAPSQPQAGLPSIARGPGPRLLAGPHHTDPGPALPPPGGRAQLFTESLMSPIVTPVPAWPQLPRCPLRAPPPPPEAGEEASATPHPVTCVAEPLRAPPKLRGWRMMPSVSLSPASTGPSSLRPAAPPPGVDSMGLRTGPVAGRSTRWTPGRTRRLGCPRPQLLKGWQQA